MREKKAEPFQPHHSLFCFHVIFSTTILCIYRRTRLDYALVHCVVILGWFPRVLVITWTRRL